MKFFLLLVLLLSFLVLSSLYISEIDNSLELEIKSIKHKDNSKLLQLHKKYANLDINSKDLDLEETIKEIKKDRELYPLDNILLRVDIELEHKRANKSNQSSNYSTPNN